MLNAKGMALAAMLMPSAVCAQKAYAPGVTDTSIKFGNTMPYSGPVSALGNVGKIIAAYFAVLNDAGGVNGRKLEMISLDDGFAPPKTVEDVKKLVESDGVAFIYATMGTAPSTAVAKYLNVNKIPQVFAISSAAKWADPAALPWSIALPWAPNYPTEAALDIAYARAKTPDATFAVLYQNDDTGKEYIKGVRETLGEAADRVLLKAVPFEVTEPTIDSQIVSLAATKADVFLIYSVTPRACAQAIRKAAEVNWRPVRFLSGACANVDAVLKPAGLDVARDILALGSLKPVDVNSTDKAMKDYVAFMRAHVPSVDPTFSSGVYAYYIAQALVAVLERCKDDLTRENIMKQATSLKGVEIPVLLPGITLNTSATDYAPIKDGYMMRFDGERFIVVSDLLKAQR